MIEPSTAQAVYNDMGALADLRSRARANPNEAVEDVAQQFEALFIQMMLKSMRDAVEDGGLFGSHQLETYQQMADQQLSLEMASDGGIGLAEALNAQLSLAQKAGQSPAGDQKASATSGLPLKPSVIADGVSLVEQEHHGLTIYRQTSVNTLYPPQESVVKGPITTHNDVSEES